MSMSVIISFFCGHPDMSQNPVSGGLRITRSANPWALGKRTLANGWEGKGLVQAF